MPNRRAKLRWEHPTYKYAYVREHRGMACTVIHGSDPLSTGYKFVPSAKTKAMMVLQQRLDAYHNVGPSEPKENHTVLDVWNEFVRVRFPVMGRPNQLEYTRYMKFVPPGLSVGNIPAIRNAVARSLAEHDYDGNTVRNVYRRIRSVFKFGVAEEMMQANPITPSLVPKETVNDPEPYTKGQIEALKKGLTGRSKAFFLFLLGSGCRSIEAVRLEWEHVFDDYCVVFTFKGGKRSKRFRVVPFALCPEVETAIAMARKAKYDSVLVFGLKGTSSVREDVNEVLGDDNTGLNAIRKYVANEWRAKGLSEIVRLAIMGHEGRVSDKHYLLKYTASDLVGLASDSKGLLKGKRRRKPA